MYLVEIGGETFNPEHVVRIFRPAEEDDVLTVRVLLSYGEPLLFRGADALAFLAFAEPGIHRFPSGPDGGRAGDKFVVRHPPKEGEDPPEADPPGDAAMPPGP